MRFATFTRSAKLIRNRLMKISEQLKVYKDDIDVTPALKQILLAYQIEIKAKQAEFDRHIASLLNTAVSDDVDDNVISEFVNEIGDLAINISSKINTLLPDGALDVSVLNQSLAPTPSSVSSVRLPKLEIKQFSGDISTWVTYINVFDASVHQSTALSLPQKQQYLLGSLGGEPLDLIKSLPISAANYLISYNLLRKRYHSPRRLLSVHLNEIIDLPTVVDVSASHLRTFLNSLNSNTQALKALDCDVAADNPLLFILLLRKLSLKLRKKFEDSRTNIPDLPTVLELTTFLDSECFHTENATISCDKQTSHNYGSNKTARTMYENKPVSARSKVTLIAARSSHTVKCTFCSGPHRIYSCPQFNNKSVHDRMNFIRSNKHCGNCLQSTHGVSQCKSKYTCKECGKRHHTLLHAEVRAPAQPAAKPEMVVSNSPTPPRSNQITPRYETPASTSFVGVSQHPESTLHQQTTVLLATTLVQLSSPLGQSYVFRAILDSASQSSIISQNAVQILSAPRVRVRTHIGGVGQAQTKSKGITHLNISNLSGHTIVTSQPMLILDHITGSLPSAILSDEVLQAVKPYLLADPTFYLTSPIDVLLGADLFPLIFNGESYTLGPNLPHILGTIFGFVVMGHAPCLNMQVINSNVTSLLTTHDTDLHKLMQQFWKIEQLPDHHVTMSQDEQLCEDHFAQTHTRDNCGRYIVRLPFKTSSEQLGNSSNMAMKRFVTLEKNLLAKPELRQSYVNFMQDYATSGHMVKCTSVPTSDDKHYFLPHHGVFKEKSTTTKLRVVFDASARSSSGTSLNDLLLPGPKLQKEICDVITLFRRHPVVVSTDIRQMYRQIMVSAEDQPYQLIYWREEPDQPLSVFKLTTVTYGVTSAPFLALRTLQQLLTDEGHAYPLAAVALKNQIFVDDIICGADSIQEALTLQRQLIELLGKGGFELRKWTTNAPQLTNALPQEHVETPLLFHTPDEPSFSILGLRWMPNADEFSYCSNICVRPPTKRNVLSSIAQIFDPCGWLVPIVFWAKRLMQLLWTLGLQWDEALPIDLAEKWMDFLNDIPAIQQISVPRYLKLAHACNIQLHGFCDASEAGYGCCVYLRCVDAGGNVTISLLMAKSRVAPLKTLSIPRLELCAAHLLARLLHHCTTLLATHYTINTTMAWTDSSVALSWIHTPPYRLKTFVANRVAELQDWTPPNLWHHVVSAQNPADIASRGLLATSLINSTLWWFGPSWLVQPQDQWPAPRFELLTEEGLPELKHTPLNTLINTANHQEGNTLLEKYSAWSQLVRIIAYVRRFINNCRTTVRQCGPLSSFELSCSNSAICKLVQASAFEDDFMKIATNQQPSMKLRRLDPFIDDDGLIRVGGRLRHSTLGYAAKHPILLPKKHHIVNILIDFHHKKYLHAGPQLLQSLLCRQYWIMSARSIIRSRIYKCMVCFKCKPHVTYPKMGDLPQRRITPSRAFSVCGVDYAGPFNIKIHTLRSAKIIKAYLCLFVCFATKAVHLEVTTDLTSETYIAALTRFTSRRGLCAHIYSDCGTNFVGASTQLEKVIRSFLRQDDTRTQLNAFAQHHSINFHFIPPANPHHGGLWEAAVKSAKHHLTRVIGEQILTLEELITLTTRVEAILNSRPLSAVSNDPEDLDALTPGHFLIGSPLCALPELDTSDVNLNRLKRWKLVQSLSQRLWRSWQNDYLHTLQQRAKWTTPQDTPTTGDLVLIHEPNSPPFSWKTGRVIREFPGPDGITRVVTIRTGHGVLTRPLVKVSALPLN